jgi:hypothetical protein
VQQGYNQWRRSRREPIKRLAFLRNVAPHDASGFDFVESVGFCRIEAVKTNITP